MNRKPRLLVLVTLAEAGGAQTFAGALVRGLQGEYDISVGAHGPRGALVDTCARLGVPFYHLENLTRDPHLRLDVAAAIEIRRLVERLEPDVVQLNSSKAALIARIALGRTARRVVYTVHGWAFLSRRGISSAFYAATERLASPLADAIVCVSAHDRREAEARGVAHPDRLRVIHNGVASPAVPPRRGSWPERPVLVCTARLAPPKDLLLLVDALAEPGVEAWRLKIIGDGPERVAIEDRRDARGLRDRVELLGERQDVAELLAQADAFVLPTRSEGMPYSILEAMGSGLPVVASRVGGIPEEVVDGVTGFVVPAGDRGALASALRRLHEEPSVSRRMGAAGHQRVRQHFRLETMVDNYDFLFRSLLLEQLPSRAPQPRRVA
jgi:glycosyltransferase involved in cell wall biosynthesis